MMKTRYFTRFFLSIYTNKIFSLLEDDIVPFLISNLDSLEFNE